MLRFILNVYGPVDSQEPYFNTSNVKVYPLSQTAVSNILFNFNTSNVKVYL